MIGLILYVFCVFVALGSGLVAGWSDFRGMTIPNILSVLVVASFPLAFGVAHLSGAEVFHQPWLRYCVAAGVILVITFAMFSLRMIGGGDAKILSAYALWAGVTGIPPLLFSMALCGAVLGVAAIIIRRTKPFSAPREGSWIARLQAGENRVPYGIPIVVGAFIAFYQLDYLDPQTLLSFFEET